MSTGEIHSERRETATAKAEASPQDIASRGPVVFGAYLHNGEVALSGEKLNELVRLHVIGNISDRAILSENIA